MNNKKEFILWGSKNGIEDIIKINGEETQTDFNKVKRILEILKERKEFSNIRVQTIDFNETNFKDSWVNTIKK